MASPEVKKKSYSEIVAEEFIEALESGNSFVQKRWEAGEVHAPYNMVTGNRYRGINNLRLFNTKYTDPRWMTFKQASSIGGKVRKGEKGTKLIFWLTEDKRMKYDDITGKPLLDKEGNPEYEIVKLDRPRAMLFTVFNGQQIDNIPDYIPEKRDVKEINERALKILKDSGANIKHSFQDQAYYSPSRDEISLPMVEQFISPEAYVGTSMHELAHWTGHESRMNRDFSGSFGSQKYAREELRAEITSFMLSQKIGIEFDPERHKMYVKNWVQILKDQPKEITLACIDAENMSDYILSLEKDVNLDLNVEKAPVITNSVNDDMSTFEEKIYLKVPYSEKNEAKNLGAKWDKTEKSWYAPAGTDLKESGLDKWFDESVDKELNIEKTKSPVDDVIDRFKISAESHGYQMVIHTLSENGIKTHHLSIKDEHNRVPENEFSLVITDPKGDWTFRAEDREPLSLPIRFSSDLNNVVHLSFQALKPVYSEPIPMNNDLKSITLVWSEKNRDQDLVFKSIDDLDNWFKESFKDEITPVNEGYHKNKISIEVATDTGEIKNLVARVDVSESPSDFNPRTQSLREYLKEGFESAGIDIDAIPVAYLEGKEVDKEVQNEKISNATIKGFTNFSPNREQPDIFTVSAQNPILDETLQKFYDNNVDYLNDNGLDFEYIPRVNSLRVVTKDIEDNTFPVVFSMIKAEEGSDRLKINFSEYEDDVLIDYFKKGGAGTISADSQGFDIDRVDKLIPDNPLISGIVDKYNHHSSLQKEHFIELEKTYLAGDFEEFRYDKNIYLDYEKNLYFVPTISENYSDVITKYELHDFKNQEPLAKADQKEPANDNNGKIYLHVPYLEKNEARSLGAKWDKAEKSWYAPAGTDLKESGLDKWSEPKEKEPENLSGKGLVFKSHDPRYEVTLVARNFNELLEKSKVSADGTLGTVEVHDIDQVRYFRPLSNEKSSINGAHLEASSIDKLNDLINSGAGAEKIIESEKEALKLAETFGIKNELQLNKAQEKMNDTKTFLDVPFIEKNEAKSLGAKWDKVEKSWYAPAGTDLKESGLDKWVKPVGIKAEPRSIEQQFSEALISAGIEPPKSFNSDGKIHRVRTFDDKGNKKSGAYALHLNQEVAGGYIRNLKTGEEINWKAEGIRSSLTPAEKQQLQKEAEQARAKREAEIEVARGKASNVAKLIWDEGKPVTKHDYCEVKQIDNVVDMRVVPDRISENGKDLADELNLKIINNPLSKNIMYFNDEVKNKDAFVMVAGDLIVPVMDINGDIKSLQTIQSRDKNSSWKSFIKGGEKSGCFYSSDGKKPDSKSVILAEGFATAQSVAKMTGKQVLTVFDAGNIKKVAEIIRNEYPKAEIIIASDNDHIKRVVNGKELPNTGVVKAMETAKEFDCLVITPPFDAKDKGTDWNDLMVDKGFEHAKYEFNKSLKIERESKLDSDFDR